MFKVCLVSHVKKFYRFFFLVLDVKRCNMSLGKGKCGRKRKWEGEEAIFNCINNQSFLFGHEKALAMGKKKREREGKERGEV